MFQEYRRRLLAAGRSTATISQRIGDVKRFAQTVPDLLKAREDDVTDYFASHPDWKPEYRKNVATSLRQFFVFAVETGLMDTDPSSAIPGIHVPRTARQPAPDEVIERALAGANLHVQAILLLGGTLGLTRRYDACPDADRPKVVQTRWP